MNESPARQVYVPRGGERAQAFGRVVLWVEGDQYHPNASALSRRQRALEGAQRVDEQGTSKRAAAIEHRDEHRMAAMHVEVAHPSGLVDQFRAELVDRLRRIADVRAGQWRHSQQEGQ